MLESKMLLLQLNYKPWCAGMLLLLGLSGCSFKPTMTVGVDGIGTGINASQTRYTLESAVDGVDESDLHFIEYARYIDSALQQRGMRKADSLDTADVIVAVNYGSSLQTRTVFRPLNNDLFHYRHRCLGRPHSLRCRRLRSLHARDRFSIFARDRADVVVSRRAFIALEARSTEASAGAPALWATRARAAVSTSDLRVVMPWLIAAAADYIGTDTQREVVVSVDADDAGLQRLKNQTALPQ